MIKVILFIETSFHEMQAKLDMFLMGSARKRMWATWHYTSNNLIVNGVPHNLIVTNRNKGGSMASVWQD